ncbi:hypothetical protein LTR70_010165 [Exophiala xenobiotica]|uniref:Cytochrome P450 n=1 Tax=Lithohypha guttulata TaxID=1690604 RepID=A0ABR0JUY1_9EURO|nr:hypothetical protein LTR24_010126 [Lithohypha guttulata]KAK5309575.1 hypothetical protein LTR70_010165 [Exophiala xenobiotica]
MTITLLNLLYLVCAAAIALSWLLQAWRSPTGKWPLNLGLLKIQYDALRRNDLLNFQQPHIEKYGPTFELDLLGGRGFTTTDPVNLEAMYNSRIQDWGDGLTT